MTTTLANDLSTGGRRDAYSSVWKEANEQLSHFSSGCLGLPVHLPDDGVLARSVDECLAKTKPGSHIETELHSADDQFFRLSTVLLELVRDDDTERNITPDFVHLSDHVNSFVYGIQIENKRSAGNQRDISHELRGSGHFSQSGWHVDDNDGLGQQFHFVEDLIGGLETPSRSRSIDAPRLLDGGSWAEGAPFEAGTPGFGSCSERQNPPSRRIAWLRPEKARPECQRPKNSRTSHQRAPPLLQSRGFEGDKGVLGFDKRPSETPFGGRMEAICSRIRETIPAKASVPARLAIEFSDIVEPFNSFRR